MKNKIHLNKEISIDIPKLIEGGMVILANSGGGKSYAIRKIAEEAVNQVQTIIIDPEGEFASLREKYDFILAGKNADVPVEVRSASLLATKLLELGKSAVIDLYELHPSERQRYVKLFCDAMVNCPKELYHPVIVILDEAHEYVPEGKPSEATWAVESLASKGRKRGQRLILASQRISKLSKNASAECNNKLIGRASQDIDMKRAGDELGFSKENMVQLRQLKPGEFFAFGSAISDEVLKLKIGEVHTEHAKVGYKNNTKVPPPSHIIKKVLGELADLPQEAEKEAKTLAELKKQNTELKRMNTNLLKHPFQKDLTDEEIIKIASPFIARNNKEWEKVVRDWQEFARKCYVTFQNNTSSLQRAFEGLTSQEPAHSYPSQRVIITPKIPMKMESVKIVSIKQTSPVLSDPSQEEKPITGGALRMLKVLVSRYPIKLSRAQLATFSKMKQSGTFGTYLSTLKTQNLIETEGDLFSASQAGIDYLGETPNPPQSTTEVIAMWKENLSGGARRMFEALVEYHPTGFTKEALGEQVGMSYISGSFGTYLSILRSNGLIEIRDQTIHLSENLFV